MKQDLFLIAIILILMCCFIHLSRIDSMLHNFGNELYAALQQEKGACSNELPTNA